MICHKGGVICSESGLDPAHRHRSPIQVGAYGDDGLYIEVGKGVVKGWKGRVRMEAMNKNALGITPYCSARPCILHLPIAYH